MAESPKAETRLGPVHRAALKAYMRDNHLGNESEVLRSALGHLLEREGYLVKCEEEPGGYRIPDRNTPASAPKQDGPAAPATKHKK